MKTENKFCIWIIAIFGGFLLILVIGVKIKEANMRQTPEGRAILAQQAADRAVQKAAREVEEFENDKEVYTIYLVKQMVTESAKNPASVDFESISKVNDAICVYYRATNSFGGIVPGIAVFRNGKISYKTSEYRKYC